MYKIIKLKKEKCRIFTFLNWNSNQAEYRMFDASNFFQSEFATVLWGAWLVDFGLVGWFYLFALGFVLVCVWFCLFVFCFLFRVSDKDLYFIPDFKDVDIEKPDVQLFIQWVHWTPMGPILWMSVLIESDRGGY